MVWTIDDVIYVQRRDVFLLKLQGGTLKMIVEIFSATPVSRGDTLYPIKDAKYLINKDYNRPVKVICASEFSATYWLSQKRTAVRQTKRQCVLHAN
ncbi:TPA: polymyxin B resistance protein pmrD [Klebsiella variicola]|nr:polymyxin B resistance protein pmrD [Klebsiella variicola]